MDLGTASPSTASPPTSAAGTDLQFDRAEFSSEAKPSLTCVGCNHAISETYYAAGDKILCAACRENLAREQVGGSGLGRFARALLFGIPAAILGSAIYYGVAALTGYEIGLVAIVIGLLVGGAVRRGSRGRGGWRYQTLAVVLTYLSITATYVPYIFQGMIEEAEKGETAANAPAEGERVALLDPSEEGDAAGVVAPVSATSNAEEEEAAGLGSVLLAIGVLMAFAMVAPFFGGPIGLFIIGIGLYEAWKMNRRADLAITGPHQVGATAG